MAKKVFNVECLRSTAQASGGIVQFVVTDGMKTINPKTKGEPTKKVVRQAIVFSFADSEETKTYKIGGAYKITIE